MPKASAYALGVDRKGGPILIEKDGTLNEQAVLKRKRRNNTARGDGTF